MSRRGSLRRCGCTFLLLPLLLAPACDDRQPTSPTYVVINQQQTLVLPPGFGGGGATPTPAAGGAVSHVTLSFFGGQCPAGLGEVRNGLPMRVGCVAFATATPRDEAGEKLPPAVHGPDCVWGVDHPEILRVQLGENPFNADLVALAPGIARVTASVRGVVGRLDVEVR